MLQQTQHELGIHKINTYQSITFLYINNEQSEKKLKETTPFTTATERIKYFRINQGERLIQWKTETQKEMKR